MIAGQPDTVALLDSRTIAPARPRVIDWRYTEVGALLRPGHAHAPARVVAIQNTVDSRDSVGQGLAITNARAALDQLLASGRQIAVVGGVPGHIDPLIEIEHCHRIRIITAYR